MSARQVHSTRPAEIRTVASVSPAAELARLRRQVRELERVNGRLLSRTALRAGDAARRLHAAPVPASIYDACEVTERERLEREILRISDQERERIGQDLHDGLCQLLSGIKFKARLLEEKLEARSAAEAEEARALEGHLNAAIQQARGIARGLHPVALEARGLISALKDLAAGTTAMYGIACACEFGRNVLVHDRAVAAHLYRIAQEATNNAAQHGGATRIDIRLTQSSRRLSLVVRDNGRGFDAGAARKAGMGLHLMEYRARAIGAHVEIDSRPGNGATINCWLRLDDSHQPAGK